jgi:DNA-binding IclR family transcriptional regulator
VVPLLIYYFTKMEIRDLIIKTLAASAGPMKASEIAEAANLGKNEVDKAMNALKAEGRIVSPKRCYWTTS